MLVVCTVLMAGGNLYRTTQHANKSEQSARDTQPAHDTVTPKDTSIQQLGGWQRVSPADKDPVFAYSDTLGGVDITVSQQPLPASFRTNTDEHVANLAKKFNATSKITAGGTTAYIGLSSSGPQSVILTKKNVLILIKSKQKIDDATWTSYITSLQ